MTSLLGRMLRLFPESVRLEDLFTEAVARLLERRPELCLSWLDELNLITPVSGEDQRYVRVTTQKSFVALDEHGSGSRPDLIVKVHHMVENAELESPPIEVVMLESKIGSWEGAAQLRRYAEHLNAMTNAERKTLLYITRNYDPKEPDEILSGLGDNVHFKQLRWHDFYTFLQTVEKDALTEEVMTFMEEQGMSQSHRFSSSDLMALSGVPRAFEIFDETLGDEVRAELESFAGSKISGAAAHGLEQIRVHKRYIILAPFHEWGLQCYAAYELRTPHGYPEARVFLEALPKRAGREATREASVAAMRKIALRDEWTSSELDEPTGYAKVSRGQSLASFLAEEDHVAAVKAFFIESIHQLREELTAFKKEHPDLPWNGGS